MRWRLRHSLDRPPFPTEATELGLFESAAARFNASEAGRTVAGLVRTLGEPQVSVGASAGRRDEVRVTVAWELTWYQWGVDVHDPSRPVTELARGTEIAELDAAARFWNASATASGQVVLAAPERRAFAAAAKRR